MAIPSVHLPARMLTLDDVAELADRDPDHRYELQEGNLQVATRVASSPLLAFGLVGRAAARTW